MLSRTAGSLYWTGRLVERADYMARKLDAATRLATLPTSTGSPGNPWESALKSSGVADAFAQAHDVVDETSVRNFLAFDLANPASIAGCLEAARHQARSVRTALTVELWEAINDAWNQLQRTKRPKDREAATAFLDWVKSVSLAFDGAVHRTMLRNDGYHFLRLGAELERADNTARLLDVKYHLLLPAGEPVGGGLDYFQWTTLLREVSALTAYRWVYHETVKPWLVADLLILNRQMPRSLASCQRQIVEHLDAIAEAYGRQGESQRLAATTLNALSAASMDDIFQSGLHEFIGDFLSDNNRLGVTVAEQYLL
ncbi:MAG: alpha-E domain-containing protein [Phenylobacterium sp.]